MKILKSIALASILVSSAMAIEPISKEPGFSGYLILGAGHVQYESNEVAGNAMLDVEDNIIQNRGTPESQKATIPVVTGTLRYTLDDKRTEFFIGNSLEDYLRMDATLALGVRHNFDDIGILGIRLLASSMPTDVYQDPLLTGVYRQSTERTSSGLGLKWESILGSNFEVDLRARNIDFDNDYNGLSLLDNNNVGGIAGPNGERYISYVGYDSLQRKGTMASAELLYTWDVNDNNFLIPAIKFTNNDRNGDARDYTQVDAKLTYVFANAKWLIASSINFGSSSFDNTNPVFYSKQDTDYVGGGINATYKDMFGWKGWGINAGVYGSRGNSDIDFYDTELFIASLAVAYNF